MGCTTCSTIGWGNCPTHAALTRNSIANERLASTIAACDQAREQRDKLGEQLARAVKLLREHARGSDVWTHSQTAERTDAFLAEVEGEGKECVCGNPSGLRLAMYPPLCSDCKKQLPGYEKGEGKR